MVKNRQYYLIDIGIAAEHFCLQAAEISIGTCLLSWFNEEGVKKLVGVPKWKRIDLIIAVGYPLVKQERPKKRKETDLIRSYNRY